MAQPRNRVGGGSLTREQFLLREMRIVADLRTQGEPDDEIIQRVKRENLFQYGTERMLTDRARACLQRLDALENADASPESREAAARLTELIAHGAPEAAGQANLYAMIRRYELMRAFIGIEIADRLACLDYTFTRVDMNAFFTRYQLENAEAATWSDATVYRIKSTLASCLINVSMLDSTKGGHLSPLMLDFEVESAMKENGDADIAAALSGLGAM